MRDLRDAFMRIHVPDLEKMKTWTPPKAEKFARS